MRDKYSHEVARTLYPYGFYRKFTDAGWRNQATKQMNKQEDPGLADGVFVTAVGKFPCAAFIECKTGDTRFAFDKWNDRQREFAIACSWSGIPYYIFLVMGDAVNSKTNPRIVFMVTAQQMFDVIALAGDRKSLSYKTAVELWTPLLWKGNGQWDIPLKHSFWEIIDGIYTGNRTLRTNSHQGRFAAGGYTSDPSPAKHITLSTITKEAYEKLCADFGNGGDSYSVILKSYQPDHFVSTAGDGNNAELP